MTLSLSPAASAGVAGVFHWLVWLFMTFAICSQFLGIVWDKSTKVDHLYYGADPATGLTALSGFNDEPYGDRMIVCLAQGRSYVSRQLTAVLANDNLAPVIDASGNSTSGFRVVHREEGMTLDAAAAEAYTAICDNLDSMLDAIQDSCDALGYAVARDVLRIVNGVDSNTTHEIPKALPIVLVPFWDNAQHLGFAIPATDGSACIFRLENNWHVLRAVPKHVHHALTSKSLGLSDGTWHNGWYDALDGQRWYSSMITTDDSGAFGLSMQRFDLTSNEPLVCNATKPVPPQCEQSETVLASWGHVTTTMTTQMEHQVFATNGSRFGLFVFEATIVSTTTNIYSLETFISNASVFILLLRWLVSLAAMLYGYVHGLTPRQTTGVGAISSSRTFNLLPIMLLPKLKLTLCAFFTVGCYFEGQQVAFSSSLSIIYPAIVEFLLFYYSILNIIAKITYRRMSDALFGPTLVALCLLHYFRRTIAEWPLLELNGRLSTQIFSDEVDKLRLVEFFTTNVAMRLNGNAFVIFYFKIALLAVNLVPLLFADCMTEKKGKQFRSFPPCDIERALAIRASNVGGLGKSQVYVKRRVRTDSPSSMEALIPKSQAGPAKSHMAPLETDIVRSRVKVLPSVDKPSEVSDRDKHSHILIGYEMSRMGYFVYGGKFLISYDDWYVLSSMAPLRVVEKLWNYRITVFRVERTATGAYRVLGQPSICRLDDPQLRAIPYYDLTACAFE